jgi:Zn-dependent peptidase ImmA (M78 family)
MLPSKVKISGIDYDISIAENRKANDDGDILMGEIVYHQASIYINEDLNEQLKEATLLHEIVHGILYHMGSEMNDNEKFVEGLSSGLHQVFRDNNWSLGGEEIE